MSKLIRVVPNTLSISMDIITVEETAMLMKNYRSRIDGDRRTLEIYPEKVK